MKLLGIKVRKSLFVAGSGTPEKTLIRYGVTMGDGSTLARSR